MQFPIFVQNKLASITYIDNEQKKISLRLKSAKLFKNSFTYVFLNGNVIVI